MANQKNKLPKSVIVLNIIMIIIVLVICGLLISLLYGDQLRAEEVPTIEISAATAETAQTAESGEVSVVVTTTTKATSSVSMTKRTTEPTEPVDEPVVTTGPEEETAEAVVNDIMSYDKAFFAEDLFIGDSITTGLHLFGRLDMKNVAADTGYTPYKAYNDAIPMYDGVSRTALEYATQMQPKRIFVMLGSNGLASAGVMEESYRTLIDKLHASCPNSVVYCISVTPLAKGSAYESTSGITNDKVVAFNDFIKSVCSDNGIKYIDLYSHVADEEGYFLTEYAEVDGMHFKGKTYDLMLSVIQKELS